MKKYYKERKNEMKEGRKDGKKEELNVVMKQRSIT